MEDCYRGDERARFVLEAQNTLLPLAELCRRYGVSRKTGYEWRGASAKRGWMASVINLGPTRVRTLLNCYASTRYKQ